LFRWTLLLLAAVCAPVFAADDCYTANGSGGEVTFRVTQSGAPYSGSFRRFSGEICFAQGRLTRIDASLDPSSVDTGLPEVDAALKEKDFFAIREYPRVTFVSTSVQSQDDTHTVRGTLEIKGNRRDVEVILRSQQADGKTSISGSFTLDRLQYGIGMGDWTNTKWLGAEVKLDISATFTPKK
jgi:polyisoprenoid-binding protein YceI